MASSQSPVFAAPRHVTVIGHNSQIVPTVSFFVGGAISVRIYTADPEIEEHLAGYPGVTVTVVPEGYAERPADLPPAPYFIAVDKEDVARQIRSWLPPTTAVFVLGSEHVRRTFGKDFLQLQPPQSQGRRTIARRLTVLRRVDTLMDLARSARHPLILMYRDPDPDAIGAGLGLATIWRAAGTQPLIRYTGDVQRYQNRLLLSYLKEPIAALKDEELAQADLIAVVDCQPGFWKEEPPQARVIIDHHPLREDSVAEYVDIREGYGSTSTILAEYLIEANLPIPRRLATALLYGLTSDTDDLQRHTSSADIQVYDHLHARADRHFLARLSKSQVPMAMLDAIAWGISHRIVVRDMILIHFGLVETPDVMVQAADLALLTCGINWVVCAGVHEERLIVIFRGDGHRQDVGKRAQLAFGKLGSAGGHRTMGRAEIALGGEHVDTTVEVVVNNLFRRMSPARRNALIRRLRNHLHGAGPANPEGMVLSS
jgi:nanoRNase/pAp phosphatase (c-di-AMP/oligoRNAs hydrolase)